MKKINFLILPGLLFALFSLGGLQTFGKTKKNITVKKTTAYNKTSPFGISPASINYYMSEYTFIDSFKQSSVWITQTDEEWDTQEEHKLDLDKNGWVKSLKAKDGSPVRFTRVITSIHLHDKGFHPQGKYIVLYDGDGYIKYGFGVKREEGSVKGRDIINIPKNTPLLIQLRKINPKDYIRNIRVLKPGGICNNDPYHYAKDENDCKKTNTVYTPFEKIYATQIFHPTFLNELKHYGVLRGMVMQETPSNNYTNWNDRPKPSDARWANQPNAMPFELLIHYANLANTDPWINIAAKVDDDYVRKMAKYVKANLNKKRRVYLEYYDEAWNRWGGYAYGGNYMEKMAVKRWPKTKDKYQVLLNWYGMRTSQICKIFKDVFAGEANRVQCTMNSQAANPWVSDQMLGCPLHLADGGEVCANNIDYLGIAPYFGGYLGNAKTTSEVANWTLEQMFQEFTQGGVYSQSKKHQGGALAEAKRWMINSKKIADKYGVKLAAYEGGQHLMVLAGDGQPDRKKLINLFIKANRDPRMYNMYMRHLKDWKEIGGTLFVAFESVAKYGNSGSWGNKEYHEQNPAPKAQAFIDFQKKNPCWWDDCELK